MLLRITKNDWIMSESISDLQIAMYIDNTDKSLGVSLRALSNNGVPASHKTCFIKKEVLEANVCNRVFSVEQLQAAINKTANHYLWVGNMWDLYVKEVEEGEYHGTYADYISNLLRHDDKQHVSIFRDCLYRALSATVTELNSILDDAETVRN